MKFLNRKLSIIVRTNLEQLLVYSGVGEDVDHHGLEGSAGSISTGEEDKKNFSLDIVDVERLIVLVASLNETARCQ